MLRLFAKAIFKIFGWKVVTSFPAQIKKAVVVAAPHTSNWDFIFAIAALNLMRIPIKYAIKKEWLSTPLGPLLKWLGAIPIDRNKSKNQQKVSMVDQITEIFRQSDSIFVLIAPEGTRSLALKWKTGFYYIAKNANVPIVLGYLNYEKKHAGMGPVIYPSGNLDADLETIKSFYRKITPKYPEKGVA